MNELNNKCNENISTAFYGLEVDILYIDNGDINFLLIDTETNITLLRTFIYGDEDTVRYTKNLLYTLENKKLNYSNNFVNKVILLSSDLYNPNNIDVVITYKRCKKFIRNIYVYAIDGFLNSEIPKDNVKITNEFKLTESEFNAVSNIIGKDGLSIEYNITDTDDYQYIIHYGV